jgi:hypothetical protein
MSTPAPSPSLKTAPLREFPSAGAHATPTRRR